MLYHPDGLMKKRSTVLPGTAQSENVRKVGLKIQGTYTLQTYPLKCRGVSKFVK